MNLLTTLTLLLTPSTITAPILASALDIQTTHSTSCSRKTAAGDTVHMHYRGRLANSDAGAEFDSSYRRGRPLVFPVGRGVVIRGWDQGLLDMCIGDRRTLTIPPEDGYGDSGIGPIPGGATLVFETELVAIDGVTKDEL